MESDSLVHYTTELMYPIQFLCEKYKLNPNIGLSIKYTNDVTKVTCPQCKLELAKAI